MSTESGFNDQQPRLNQAEAAQAARMQASIVAHYAEIGMITPSSNGYSDEDLAELRRVR